MTEMSMNTACTIAHAWLGGVGTKCTKFEHTLAYMQSAQSAMPPRGREITRFPQRAAWGAYMAGAGQAAPRRGGHLGGLGKNGRHDGKWLMAV